MMMKIGLLSLLTSVMVSAGPLSFESGTIKGHTEVFGDSTIDPVFKKARSSLSMEESITSLRGSIEVMVSDFASDNRKRDANMQETLESSLFPKASFEIKEVVSKGGNNALLKGNMNLHGVTKPMSFDATITQEGQKVLIKANSMMKMSDFGVKPPKMMFLTVRDQVDLGVDIVLKR